MIMIIIFSELTRTNVYERMQHRSWEVGGEGR
jgi:hypothetical protein